MSAPARPHDAGEIPTGCPSGAFPTSSGISESPPPSGSEARWRRRPFEPTHIKIFLS
jgi:hypothetical protein